MTEQKRRSFLTVLRDHIQMDRVDAQNARRFSAINPAAAAQCATDPERPVLFFNASTRLTRTNLNAAYAWLAANSLEFSGIPIHFLVCEAGLRPCLLTARYSEVSCKDCISLSEKMYQGIPVTPLQYIENKQLSNEIEGLNGAQLESFSYQDIPLGDLTMPSLRWILRRHHLEGVPEAAPLHRSFIRSAWSTYTQANALIQKLNPRAIVVFNGLQYPEAVVKWIGKREGIPTFTHEIGLMPNTAIFTEGEATACPITLPDDFEMTPERNQRLDEYLSKRMKGNFTTAGIQFWPEMESLSPQFWDMARSFRQIVPVFTNVVFDTSQKHANVLFSNMFEWLDEVRKLIENHSDTLFVIRAHPDEIRPGKESLETVTDWVFSTHINHLPNVLFIGPDQFFSSYEIIQHAKFVMVYNSTIGLEAAIMGAGVLCAGRSRFTQVPICWFPESPEDYMKKAEELLNCGSVDIPSSFQPLARKFIYYQFFHTALSFSEFIEPDGIWNGYVRIRDFPVSELDPERNLNLKVIHDGILNGKPFVLPDEEKKECSDGKEG